MSFENEDASDWLGAEVEEGQGRPLYCPATIQTLLVQAFKDGAWTEDDTCKQADIDLWVAVVKDSSEGQKKAIQSADILRFKRWLWAHKSGDEDEAETSSPRPSSASRTARIKVRPPIAICCF